MIITTNEEMSLYKAIKTYLKKLDDADGNGSMFHSLIIYADGSGSVGKILDLGERVASFSSTKDALKGMLKEGIEDDN